MKLDLARIERFEWDAGNADKNFEKRGVTRIEAEQVFFNEPLIVNADAAHGGDESRYHALGRTEIGRRLHVTFALRGSGRLIRVISARSMSRKERERYGKA